MFYAPNKCRRAACYRPYINRTPSCPSSAKKSGLRALARAKFSILQQPHPFERLTSFQCKVLRQMGDVARRSQNRDAARSTSFELLRFCSIFNEARDGLPFVLKPYTERRFGVLTMCVSRKIERFCPRPRARRPDVFGLGPGQEGVRFM